MTKISIRQFREIGDKILNQLEHDGVDSVDIDVDFYWDVPVVDRYDPHKTPSSLDLGQISDDINELMRISQGEAVAVRYALVWLAAVLRRIGEQD